MQRRERTKSGGMEQAGGGGGRSHPVARSAAENAGSRQAGAGSIHGSIQRCRQAAGRLAARSADQVWRAGCRRFRDEIAQVLAVPVVSSAVPERKQWRQWCSGYSGRYPSSGRACRYEPQRVLYTGIWQQALILVLHGAQRQVAGAQVEVVPRQQRTHLRQVGRKCSSSMVAGMCAEGNLRRAEKKRRVMFYPAFSMVQYPR